MKNIILSISLALFFQGCSYAISPQHARQVDKKISFSEVAQDPEIHKGKLVIIGGTIAQVSSTDRGTLLEVEERALDYWGRPERTKKTGGRFLLLYPAHLNSLLYAPGRELTVAATVDGAEAAGLVDPGLRIPLFLSKELKLWDDDRKARSGPQWFDPLNDPNRSVRTQ
jgi:starvation-inducible outer membrane lipoprotein